MFDVNEKSYIVVYMSTLENESLCLVCKNGHFYGFKCMYLLCNVNYFCNINTFPSIHKNLHSSWIQIMKIFKSTT